MNKNEKELIQDLSYPMSKLIDKYHTKDLTMDDFDFFMSMIIPKWDKLLEYRFKSK